MITETHNYFETVSQLPQNAEVTFYDVSWEDYEELLAEVGEASGLRISYDNGRLRVMTLSAEHENYGRFIERLMGLISVRLRINVRSFGSTTMRRQKRGKGNEADNSFYIQHADAIGNKMQLDFTVDPPPDLVVEIDVHHDSSDKMSIDADLEVTEVWRYDGYAMKIHCLQNGEYVVQASSQALPMLSSAILTEYLSRLRTEGEFASLMAFDEWLLNSGQAQRR